MTYPATISADYTFRPSELAATPALLIETRQPVISLRPFRLHKSQIAQQVADSTYHQYVDVRALLLVWPQCRRRHLAPARRTRCGDPETHYSDRRAQAGS